MNNVIPFLKLPHHTFHGEEEIEHIICIDESFDETYSSTMDSNEKEDDNDVSQGVAADAVGDRKQDGANDEERRKRNRE